MGGTMLFFVLVGCAAPESTLTPTDAPVSDPPPDESPADTAEDTSQDDDSGAPSDYIYDEEEDPGNLLGAAEVAVALREAVRGVVHEMDPFLVLDAFDAAMAAEDSDCPYHYEEYEELYGYDYWYGGCSTAEGSRYTGTIYGKNYDPFWSWYYYYTAHGWWYGTAEIDLADGQGMELSGSWSMSRYQYNTYTYVSVSAYGDARWEGADFGDTWLGEESSAAYTLYGGAAPGSGAYLSISGGVSGLTGTANAVWFDSFYMASAAFGSSCPEEPAGTVSIRDAAGDWYDVVFHGPAYAGASSFPPECDGCGEVWYEGRPIGDACVDLTSLTDWLGSPW